MTARASNLRVLAVAAAVAGVCSVLVAGTALLLREKQRANALNEQQRKILAAAGVKVGGSAAHLEEAFAGFHSVLVDLRSGALLDPAQNPPEAWNLTDQLASGETSRELSPEEDRALIRRLEFVAPVYFSCEGGALDVLVLPVRGYGLWGTLWGYLALDGLRVDTNGLLQVNTRGLEFYAHKETPGLGGEVDNPKWKRQWRGKRIYDSQGGYAFRVIRGQLPPGSPFAPYYVDGLSGATLTTNGVDDLVGFWLGGLGYWPLLHNLRGGSCPLPEAPAAGTAAAAAPDHDDEAEAPA